MSAGRRILLVGGLVLTLWGMGYGLWYAVFAEHQALNGIGGALTGAFTGAAEKKLALVGASLQQYKSEKYAYDRQVDVHSHWIGLAMLLITLAVYFDRLAFSDKWKVLLACAALFGAVVFPFGVMLQIYSHGAAPHVMAVFGSALEFLSLFLVAIGFAQRQSIGSRA